MLPALRRAQTPTMAALALYGALLLAWESAVRLDLIASDSVPSASQVVIGLVDLAGQGDYWLEVGAARCTRPSTRSSSACAPYRLSR